MFIHFPLNDLAASKPDHEHFPVCSQHKSFMNIFAFNLCFLLKTGEEVAYRCTE